MRITLTAAEIDAEQWDGENDAFITAHLGTEDWREVSGVRTQTGWWLYRDQCGDVCAMSDEMRRTRTI